MNKVFALIQQNLLAIYILIVLCFATLTYFTNYQYPNASVWDEVFHISSGEKYLSGTMFMEAHPPLGKLLIGAGEKIINVNDSYDDLNPLARLCLANTPAVYKYQQTDPQTGITSNKEQRTVVTKEATANQPEESRPMTLLDVRERTRVAVDKSAFNLTDSIGSDTNGDSKPDTQYPEYFSFCGFRFFPVLAAVFTVPLFFWLIYLITRNPHLALISSSLLAFDNALIVQARAAMLDSIQIFFIMIALILTVNMLDRVGIMELEGVKKIRTNSFWHYSQLGIVVGLIAVTKHNGLIFGVLPAMIGLWELIRGGLLNHFTAQSPEQKKLSRIINSLLLAGAKFVLCLIAALFAYVAVFYVHFGLGTNINPANSNNFGKYKASAAYQEIITREETWSVNNLPIMFADNQRYMDEYHKGVPKLDYTKQGENGSYPTNWPVMNRTISYRWETADGISYRYTYLIGNPLIWLIGLVSILVSCVLIFAKVFFDLKIKNWRAFAYIGLFLFLYMLYMAAMLYTIQVRVMYLYHYFIPLILSLILAPLLIYYAFGTELRQEVDISWKNKPFLIFAALIILVFAISWTFAFYSPFTYYLPLDKEGFEARNLFDFWQMRPAK